MFAARAVVSLALEARDKVGIKVRQPLAKLFIPEKLNVSKEHLSTIADEVNVKEVVVSGDAVLLDIVVTPELKEEGLVREFIRSVQSARRDATMYPRDKVRITYGGDDEKAHIISKFEKHILFVTNAVELRRGDTQEIKVERA